MITLTPDLEAGTVTIRLENANGVSQILRADANGTRPVRLRAGELPGAGVVTVTDYEPAISGGLMYRVVSTEPELEPAWTTLDGADLPRFIIPAIPTLAVVAELVHGYSASRPSRSIFHEIIDREDPLVAAATSGSRRGTLDVWFESYPSAKDLDDLLSRGVVVMYRQAEHPGMDMYFHAESTDITPDETCWKLSIGYREVAFPPGNVLALPSWTFAKLATTGGTFTDVRNDYRSFAELTINEAS